MIPIPSPNNPSRLADSILRLIHRPIPKILLITPIIDLAHLIRLDNLSRIGIEAVAGREAMLPLVALP